MEAKPKGITALDLVLLCGLFVVFLYGTYLTKTPVRPIPFLP